MLDVMGETENHPARKPGAQEVTAPFGRQDTLAEDAVTQEARWLNQTRLRGWTKRVHGPSPGIRKALQGDGDRLTGRSRGPASWNLRASTAEGRRQSPAGPTTPDPLLPTGPALSAPPRSATVITTERSASPLPLIHQGPPRPPQPSPGPRGTHAKDYICLTVCAYFHTSCLIWRF